MARTATTAPPTPPTTTLTLASNQALERRRGEGALPFNGVGRRVKEHSHPRAERTKGSHVGAGRLTAPPSDCQHRRGNASAVTSSRADTKRLRALSCAGGSEASPARTFHGHRCGDPSRTFVRPCRLAAPRDDPRALIRLRNECFFTRRTGRRACRGQGTKPMQQGRGLIDSA